MCPKNITITGDMEIVFGRLKVRNISHILKAALHCLVGQHVFVFSFSPQNPVISFVIYCNGMDQMQYTGDPALIHQAEIIKSPCSGSISFSDILSFLCWSQKKRPKMWPNAQSMKMFLGNVVFIVSVIFLSESFPNYPRGIVWVSAGRQICYNVMIY